MEDLPGFLEQSGDVVLGYLRPPARFITMVEGKLIVLLVQWLTASFLEFNVQVLL
jgi:hypothetical protein